MSEQEKIEKLARSYASECPVYDSAYTDALEGFIAGYEKASSEYEWKMELAMEVLEEFAQKPYSDSDPCSLFYTLNQRAKEVLKKIRGTDGK